MAFPVMVLHECFMEPGMAMEKGTGGGALTKSPISLIVPMIPQAEDFANDMELLVKELEGIKARQKALSQLEEATKANIQEVLAAMGETKYSAEKGTVFLQSRTTKQYGQAVVNAEKEYKRLKALADDLGDYEEKQGKTSVVFRPASEAEQDEAF